MTASNEMERNIVCQVALCFCAIIFMTIAHNREDLIQESVRRLLGVRSSTDRNVQLSRNLTSLPPQYLMELYEKYRSGQTPIQGNTVRSILPLRDTIGEADVLIFNLTAIKSSEQILQSKLYLMKRKKAKSGRRKEQSSHFRIKIGSLPHMTSYRYLEVSLSQYKSEWYSYDISESVTQCRGSKRNGDYLLGMTLEIRRAKGSYRLLPFKRLLKQNSQPFVLIFSEDVDTPTRNVPKSNGRSGLESLLQSKTVSELNGTALKSELVIQSARRERSVGDSAWNLHSTMSKTANSVYETSRTLKTLKKKSTISIFTQRLQKAERSNTCQKVLFLKPTSSQKKHSSSIPSSKKSLRPKRGILPDAGDANNNQSTVLLSPEPTVPALQTVDKLKRVSGLKSKFVSLSQKQSRRKTNVKESNKKKRKRRPKLPFWWTNHEHKLHSRDFEKTCQRRSLVIDFVKLGWGDWVLSPKSFNAHYCSGSCSFSLIKNAHPSNHAVIQSLVQAIGLYPDMPTPCCVPSSTSTLTLLHFDEYGSLVLKNYPNMIVDKCACR